MPIYEYQCDSCGHKLECIQKIGDDPLLTCPKCQTNSLRKLISKASFRLKGTGWYATDFKERPKQPDAGKKEAPADKKDDAKPAEKSAAATTDSGGSGKQEAGGSA